MRTRSNLEREEEEAENNNSVELSTPEDITEGGLIGAVGGGLVGAIAGGPIGAVIGAALGGVASAVAIDVVDQYDQDNQPAPAPPETNEMLDAGVYKGDFAGPIDPLTGDYDLSISSGHWVPAASREEQIRRRAYELWDVRGRRDGQALDDWLDAELELQHPEYRSGGMEDIADPEELDETVGYSS
jgi:hypothetical protein